MSCFDLARIRKVGVEKVTEEILLALNALDLNKAWIHFDTDVISDAENPAVDYRLPGGLTFDEAGYILRKLLDTDKMIGMSVTIFNPTLDADGTIAKQIVNCINEAAGGGTP